MEAGDAQSPPGLMNESPSVRSEQNVTFVILARRVSDVMNIHVCQNGGGENRAAD